MEFHLREVALDVAPGEHFVVLGPTGPGETVLLETIAGHFQAQKEMSQLLSIDHLLHRNSSPLSGGEQQRVALARAVVVEPRLLLLDGPPSALDPETREGLQRELARAHRELRTTTLHVTHDFEEAAALGDRIAVVHLF